MTDIPNKGAGFSGSPTKALRMPKIAAEAKAMAWRRVAKYGVGALLIAIGAVSTYQNVLVRTSREAVINGRVVVIRAPMDGFVTTTVSTPGSAVTAGAAIGHIADPQADDARSFALQQEASATQRERDAMLRRLADLERARREADAQAEAYRLGRVQQDELRIEETEANLAAAMAREANAASAVQRGAALHLRGFQSDEAYERALHAQEIARYETIAARKRLDSLRAELQAARVGTYLGDNYNDVPSSFQRARELVVRIEETSGVLDQLARKAEAVTAQLAAERERFTARAMAALTVPISGNLWTMPAVSGEYVRKGQDLLTVVDCSTAMVTAAVTDREFNELRLGDPVRFRIAGTTREYAGSIAKLGLASTGGTFAISPEEHRHQLAVNVPELKYSPDDACAVGRTGEVVFEGRGSGNTARIVALLRRSLGLS
jgi:multidrug resistance efflux pump